jgi:hypothetical protein
MHFKKKYTKPDGNNHLFQNKVDDIAKIRQSMKKNKQIAIKETIKSGRAHENMRERVRKNTNANKH